MRLHVPSSLWILSILNPGIIRNDVSVALHRMVQTVTAVLEHRCLGIAWIRRRKSQELQGRIIAARHFSMINNGFWKQEETGNAEWSVRWCFWPARDLTDRRLRREGLLPRLREDYAMLDWCLRTNVENIPRNNIYNIHRFDRAERYDANVIKNPQECIIH